MCLSNTCRWETQKTDRPVYRIPVDEKHERQIDHQVEDVRRQPSCNGQVRGLLHHKEPAPFTNCWLPNNEEREKLKAFFSSCHSLFSRSGGCESSTQGESTPLPKQASNESILQVQKPERISLPAVTSDNNFSSLGIFPVGAFLRLSHHPSPSPLTTAVSQHS